MGSAIKVLVAIHYSVLVQCTSCQKWVHKKCSGVKGSMSKVAKSFICRGCLNSVTSACRTSSTVLGKITFEMISNQNQNHESLTDLKS